MIPQPMRDEDLEMAFYTRRTHAAAVALALLWPCGASADGITGTLVWNDGMGPQPVAFAEVKACPEGSQDGCRETITNSQGYFGILDIEPGRYDVTLSYQGGGLSEVIVVPAGGVADLTFAASD